MTISRAAVVVVIVVIETVLCILHKEVKYAFKVIYTSYPLTHCKCMLLLDVIGNAQVIIIPP
jgi:hypothetical protein